MKEWCLQHPWLTFFVLLAFAEALGNWGRIIIKHSKS